MLRPNGFGFATVMRCRCALLLAIGLVAAAPPVVAAYSCQAKVVLADASQAAASEDDARSAAATLLTPLASGGASADLLARLLTVELSAAHGADVPLVSGARLTDTFELLGPDAGELTLVLTPRTRLPDLPADGRARLAWTVEIAAGDFVIYARTITQEPGLPPLATGDTAPLFATPGTPYRLTITLEAEITAEAFADAALSYQFVADASLHLASASGAALPSAGGSWGGVKALYR